MMELRQAYIFSLSLHGIVLLSILLFATVQRLFPDRSPKMDFVLVTPSENRGGSKSKPLGLEHEGKLAEGESSLALRMPDFGTVPVIPNWKAPETPAPAQSSPSSALPPPAAEKQKPVVKPAEKGSIRTSYEEFKRQQNKSRTGNKAVQEKPNNAQVAVRANAIDLGELRSGLQQLQVMGGGGGGGGSVGGVGPGGVAPSEWDRWAIAVKVEVERVWQRPEQLRNLNLAAQVRFDVSAVGLLSNVHIAHSSGNTVMDQSILQSLRSLKRVKPPPGGEAVTASIEFKLQDR